jgi:S-(hydroxymethyl)glutathione dehydrogenase / alcohol dehydrogenase
MNITAAILVKQKKPLVIDEISFPDKLGYGQVLVKLKYTGICGSQIGEIDGVKGPDKYLPHLLGHEGSGEVVECGPGVAKVSPKDNVILHWRPSSGIQALPPKYFLGKKQINAGWVTTFNDFAIISENRLTLIPKNIDFKTAALFGCAITTGFGVVENNAKIQIGESVIVFGAGGVGLNIIQALKLRSAYPIIAVDIFENRLKLAKKMGATHVLNSLKNDFKEKLSSLLKKIELDCFIDNTGNPKIIKLGYEVIKKNGRVVCVGVPKSGKNISIHSLDLHFGKSIIGSHGGESNPERDIPRYSILTKNDKNIFNRVITKIYKLDQVNDAIDSMKNGKLTGRCLIEL